MTDYLLAHVTYFTHDRLSSSACDVFHTWQTIYLRVWRILHITDYILERVTQPSVTLSLPAFLAAVQAVRGRSADLWTTPFVECSLMTLNTIPINSIQIWTSLTVYTASWPNDLMMPQAFMRVMYFTYNRLSTRACDVFHIWRTIYWSMWRISHITDYILERVMYFIHDRLSTRECDVCYIWQTIY